MEHEVKENLTVDSVMTADGEVVPLGPVEVAVSNLYRDPVDSWEKLEEDLGRVASYDKGCTPVCAYTRQPCAVCKFHSSEECTGAMCADIASRIRKLRGKD